MTKPKAIENRDYTERDKTELISLQGSKDEGRERVYIRNCVLRQFADVVDGGGGIRSIKKPEKTKRAATRG